jgi:hypothetical protein
LEKEVNSLDEKKNGRVKNPNEDTEYDSDMTNIAKKFEADSVFDSNHLENLKRIKKFFEKNRRIIKDNKEIQSYNKINLANHSNLLPIINSSNFYADSMTNVPSDIGLLNKKRKQN